MQPVSGVPVEREVKIAIVDADAVRANLLRVGARPLGGAMLEDDRLFDDEKRSLATRGHALRLRQQRPLGGGGAARTVLTWKGPSSVDGGHRVREEVETEVADAVALSSVLAGLGYSPAFRYQKVRELFQLDGALVALDRTALGAFLEVEGEAASVDAAAARLGHPPADYITQSYPALWRLQHASGDMLMADPLLLPREDA